MDTYLIFLIQYLEKSICSTLKNVVFYNFFNWRVYSQISQKHKKKRFWVNIFCINGYKPTRKNKQYINILLIILSLITVKVKVGNGM